MAVARRISGRFSASSYSRNKPCSLKAAAGRERRAPEARYWRRFDCAAQRRSPTCPTEPVVIAQPQAPTPQLPVQDTILFNEVAESFALLVVQPSRESGEQQLERRGIQH